MTAPHTGRGRVDSGAAIVWSGAQLQLLDQRALPEQVRYLSLATAAEVHDAIRDMVVRGAPAIGIAAAYGIAMAARDHYARSPAGWRAATEADLAKLRTARPTAVNLMWALDRMRAVLVELDGDPGPRVIAEAEQIHAEDVAANRRMGALGAELLGTSVGVLTHCNAGALATGGYGTALGVVRAGFEAGRIHAVFADETRPWLQGARLTAWELQRDGIPVQIITDAAASFAMQAGKVDWVIVGADRVAANGDVANKIGTYSLAVSARHHRLGFMVVAPTSTIDLDIPSGDAIPIEERGADEILSLGGQRVAAAGAGAWNPVFDVTPAALVDVLVTERGVVHAPDRAKVIALMGG